MRIFLSVIFILVFASSGQAIPTLQLGAPAGLVDSGAYADYLDWAPMTGVPGEQDTARTTGGTIYAVGSYGNNSNNAPLLVGGQYADGTRSGDNWTDFDLFNWSSLDSSVSGAFNSAGAIILATVPEDTYLSGGWTFTIGGLVSFYGTTERLSYPNSHDPTKDSNPDKAYLFFDIGNFASDEGPVDNLADESGSDQYGEMKELALLATDFDFIHLDLMALVTDEQGNGQNARLVTTFEVNANSKDLTWVNPNGGGGGGGGVGTPIPEPGTILLLGAGLVGLGLCRLRKK